MLDDLLGCSKTNGGNRNVERSAPRWADDIDKMVGCRWIRLGQVWLRTVLDEQKRRMPSSGQSHTRTLDDDDDSFSF